MQIPSRLYREDCWSEGETSVLIDAWGDRFLDLNRRNLRRKQWQEVAISVNSRPGSSRRPPRTDVQCKNRIDTLKKKYKIEKGRISNGVCGTNWCFYSRLDMLIGSSLPVAALPLPKNDFLSGRNYAAAAAAAAAAAEVESGRSDRLLVSRDEGKRSGKRRRGGDGGGMGELARAIEWFAGVYETVEVEKQRQMVELEKERIKFMKGLEFQRMQMFMDTRVQVEKIKVGRGSRSDAGEETF